VGNTGAWSATTTFVATSDNIPPSTPAAPSVAASRIAVQVTHTLGVASGGTFNLESDLDHLEIHAQYEPSFTPTDATLLGKLKANAGMIQAEIPAVGTYQVDSTVAVYVRVVAVDISGNRSGPSDAASATALLIDDAHISDLTVSKVTAGTVSASWVMAGEIKTADTGARARLSSDGIELYDATGARTFFGSAADGSLTMVGQLRSTLGDGSALVVNPTGTSRPSLRFYSPDGSKYSEIYGLDEATTGSDSSIKLVSSNDASNNFYLMAALQTKIGIGYVTRDGSNLIQPVGGYLQVVGNDAIMSYGPGGRGVVRTNDTFTRVGYNESTSTERVIYIDSSGMGLIGLMRGLTTNHDAVICGVSGDTSSGITDLVISYGATITSTPYPLAFPASTGNVGGLRLQSYDTGGFTVRRETSTSSFRIGYWSFRS
jgi:hypothetical protein